MLVRMRRHRRASRALPRRVPCALEARFTCEHLRVAALKRCFYTTLNRLDVAVSLSVLPQEDDAVFCLE